MNPVTILLIGAGSRGSAFARFIRTVPDQARIAGVAEPRPFYRQRIVDTDQIAPENAAADWQALAARPKFADAVIIATPDRCHAEPAIAFAEKGYAILLEKPMATTADDCRRIVAAVQKNNVLFAVFHDFRYFAYTQRLKQLIDSGIIGEVTSVQHLEPVGYWHYAHSYVRGNWRNEAESSSMLLAKSCHDIDWLRYILGQRCAQVSSFGSLTHFKKEQKPAEAGTALRCLDCAYEPRCPYSASRFYFKRLLNNQHSWPLDVITAEFSVEGVRAALREGPYGRCVYECDNDVVDHQVVNLLYENGTTASFTMVAFSEYGDRKTVIFGTRGELRGDLAKIIHYDFLTERTEVIDPVPAGVQQGGHYDGDTNVLKAFIHAVGTGDTSGILSGAEETLETHLTVFAAEESRRTGKTVNVVV
ncbi:MAG: gfo/Idh/MocA family oxidoreductase [Chloroflexi bacterium]|nr:MAG: gfo/Idh/MocA family oxidoreductase [Chloroflexota bacterium]